jgi:hypothetical protein
MVEKRVLCKDLNRILSRYTGRPNQLENGIWPISWSEIFQKDTEKLLKRQVFFSTFLPP